MAAHMSNRIRAEGVTYTLKMSNALNKRLDRLASITDSSHDAVLKKALALYEVATNAREQSCRMAVIDNNNQVQQAIEGL